MIIDSHIVKDLDQWCCGRSIRDEFLCGQPINKDNIVVCDDCYEKIMRCINGYSQN